MPQIGYDPATGRLTLDGEVLERNDPRMWGSYGRNLFNQGAPTWTEESGAVQAHDFSDTGGYDPRYYESYIVPGSEGDGGTTRYRLKPEVERQLGGRVQLTQTGVGGYSEVLDPSQLQWSDEFGIITNPSNIGEADHGGGLGGFLSKNPWVMLLPAAYGALAAGGAFGGASGGLGAAEAGAEGFTGLGGAGGSGLAGGVPGYGAGGAFGGGAAANLAPGGPSGTAAFGTPGFGAGEWAGILPEAGSTPAMFGTPGFGGGEMFFTDTMGLGGGGGALGTGTSLVGTGLGAGTVTGPLGSGFSLAGTGLAPGAVTGTGAVAGGAAAGGSMVRDALSLARDLLGGGEGEGAGGGILGGFGAAPKIGEHRQDNDPYGLMASGYGPWTGLIPESSDSKKAKITEAMMKRNPTSTWG